MRDKVEVSITLRYCDNTDLLQQQLAVQRRADTLGLAGLEARLGEHCGWERGLDNRYGLGHCGHAAGEHHVRHIVRRQLSSRQSFGK